MSIVTPSDIEMFSGESFDENTYGLVEALIPMIQGEMEAYLGRAIEQRFVNGETHLLPIERSFVYLRNTPVSTVNFISVNGYALQQTWYFVTPMGITLYGNAWGFGYGFAPVGANVAAWLSPVATFVINYTGGLDTTSDPLYQPLRQVLIRTALNQITMTRMGDSGRAGYIMTKVEDYTNRRSEDVVVGQTGWGTKGGMITSGLFSASDMVILNRFKRRTAFS